MIFVMFEAPTLAAGDSSQKNICWLGIGGDAQMDRKASSA